MARKKSVADIQAQRFRLLDLLEERGQERDAQGNLTARAKRITDTARRYMYNIRQTKSTKAANARLERLNEDTQLEEKRNAVRKMNRMQYSQRTYMGMSNG